MTDQKSVQSNLNTPQDEFRVDSPPWLSHKSKIYRLLSAEPSNRSWSGDGAGAATLQ